MTAAPALPRFALRLVAACTVLVGIAFAQSPGLLVADTKFDLAVAPAEFLGRALHLWDAEGAFGQLQNQAYGYWWPMGPFFVLGHALDLPGWVVQRLWLALVLCTAFVGAATLARRMGARSDLACILGGLAYALSPRMLTTLGPISIEAWPSALAPWVLLPLVVGSRTGSPRRAALWSAAAVAMVGGVNAAATFAVLPLGVLWLLTREPGARRRSLMIWWPVFTLLGTLWWLVPLFVMGAYSPPFLDYIESAANTTFPTTLFDALRGTSNWVPYVGQDWRAGSDLIRNFYLPVNSGVVLMLGIAGLVRRTTPHRTFLALGVVVGLAMVTMGHVGAVQGWGAEELRGLLDGPLAPLRNVHKFDPIVRLPLVLGLVFLVDALVQRPAPEPDGARRGTDSFAARVTTWALVSAAVLAVGGAALPAVAGRVTPTGGLTSVPQYWSDASDWLAEQDSDTTLLLPGSSFGNYVWGAPRDEPMQFLARSSWAVRNAIPLAPPGNIRMLDAIEEQLAQGEPSEGLADTLRRMGVSHLVVRNDLVRSPDVPDPMLVRQALAGSPGIERITAFGPELGGEASLLRGGERIVVNGGWQDQFRALEVYEVSGVATTAATSDSAPVVVGGPEDLLDLAALGVVEGGPTVLAPDVEDEPRPGQPVVLTDGFRSVERNFGRVHDGTSATRSPDDPRRLPSPRSDYLPEGAAGWLTSAVTSGAAVSASSSMADANAFGTVEPGRMPYAAVDGDKSTRWTANLLSTGTAWWQVAFPEPRTATTVTLTAGPDSRETVRVRTSSGANDPVELAPNASRTVRLGPEPVRWLRIEDASGRGGNRLSLAEVEVPGLTVTRALRLPPLPDGWPTPDAVVIRAVDDARAGCVGVDNAERCVVERQVAGEEPSGFRRLFTLPSSVDYEPTLQVEPLATDAMVAALLEGQPAGVSASSWANPELRATGLAAVDGDSGTAWTAALNDVRPVLTLNWIGKRVVRGLDIDVARDTAARLPEEVRLEWPGGSRTVEVDRDGNVQFPPVRTDQLRIWIDEARPATNLDFSSRAWPVPIGISEIRVVGVPFFPLALPTTERELPCGSGPALTVGGTTYRTSIEASPAQLYAGGEVQAELCGTEALSLQSGETEVALEASDTFRPASLVLARPDELPVGGEAQVTEASYDAEGPAAATVQVAGGAGDLLALRHNVNPGWVATQDGRSLEPVVVDGWQQGWRLVGGGDVRVVYEPDRTYRAGLLAGLVSALLLVALLLVARRRSSGPDAPPVGDRRVPAEALILVMVVVGGALGGWWGVPVAEAGLFAALLVRRRGGAAGPFLVGAVVLPAAIAYAVEPWGGETGWAGQLAWPHYLVLFACSVVLGWLADEAPRRLRWSRIPGSSTNR